MKLCMSRLSVLLVAAILALPALNASTVFASSGNLYVAVGGTGTNCTYSNPCGSIQQAVNLATAGSRVLVGPGIYTENVTIPSGKNGLLLSGKSSVLVSAGGNPGQQAPAGVPVDIVLDIFSAKVTVQQMTIRHPYGAPTKRDIGVFVRPPAANVTLQSVIIERRRTGSNLEPTVPGSRGVLVFRALGTLIQGNSFRGNYEDHIHLPTSQSTVQGNMVVKATRIGIAVIQENATSSSTHNLISGNMVIGNKSDGIQIQGDKNIVQYNSVHKNGRYGIHLCGAGSGCAAPGMNADASGNTVIGNALSSNNQGNIGNFGTNNTVKN